MFFKNCGVGQKNLLIFLELFYENVNKGPHIVAPLKG